MKLYVLPPSPRAIKVIALKNHLGFDCDIHVVDLSRDDHLRAGYEALNPNRKMPVLDDDGFVLWESNAILQYLAVKRPDSAMWPGDSRAQADVLRWMFWEAAHWDQQACGAVGNEKVSKMVLRLGPAVPERLAQGERDFRRFATVLNDHLKGRKWLTGDAMTIADFAVGVWIPSARALELPIADYPEIIRWYEEGVASLSAWQSAQAPRPQLSR